MIRLERVVDALPLDFEALRAEAHDRGHMMLDTLATEWASGQTRFGRPGEMLLAIYVDDELAAVGGITLDPTTAGALRMRRFYVRAAYRRHGVGRALATALLVEGRRRGRVVTANAAAGSEAFWEALDFAPDRRDGHTHILKR